MNKKFYPLILAILYMLFLSVPLSFATDKKPVADQEVGQMSCMRHVRFRI